MRFCVARDPEVQLGPTTLVGEGKGKPQPSYASCLFGHATFTAFANAVATVFFFSFFISVTHVLHTRAHNH